MGQVRSRDAGASAPGEALEPAAAAAKVGRPRKTDGGEAVQRRRASRRAADAKRAAKKKAERAACAAIPMSNRIRRFFMWCLWRSGPQHVAKIFGMVCARVKADTAKASANSWFVYKANTRPRRRTNSELREHVQQLQQQLHELEAENRALRPVVIDVTGDTSCASRTRKRGSVEQIMMEGLAQTKRVKQERDEAIEDAQDEAQDYALFIDKQHEKVAALEQLCLTHGIEQHEVNAALNK